MGTRVLRVRKSRKGLGTPVKLVRPGRREMAKLEAKCRISFHCSAGNLPHFVHLVVTGSSVLGVSTRSVLTTRTRQRVCHSNSKLNYLNAEKMPVTGVPTGGTAFSLA